MNERWKQVPAFQKKEEQASPRRPQNLGEIPDNGSEVKRGVETFASEARVASDYIGNAIERISFWSLFKTIIAWILCYKDTLRTRSKHNKMNKTIDLQKNKIAPKRSSRIKATP